MAEDSFFKSAPFGLAVTSVEIKIWIFENAPPASRLEIPQLSVNCHRVFLALGQPLLEVGQPLQLSIEPLAFAALCN